MSVGQSLSWLVGLSKKCKKCKKWGIQPMSANINCFNGGIDLRTFYNRFFLYIFPSDCFFTKFSKKCQKSIRNLHGGDSIQPRLNYTRSHFCFVTICKITNLVGGLGVYVFKQSYYSPNPTTCYLNYQTTHFLWIHTLFIGPHESLK